MKQISIGLANITDNSIIIKSLDTSIFMPKSMSSFSILNKVGLGLLLSELKFYDAPMVMTMHFSSMPTDWWS